MNKGKELALNLVSRINEKRIRIYEFCIGRPGEFINREIIRIRIRNTFLSTGSERVSDSKHLSLITRSGTTALVTYY